MTSSKQGLSRLIGRFKAIFMSINFTLTGGGEKRTIYAQHLVKEEEVTELHIIITNQDKARFPNNSLGHRTGEHHLLRSLFPTGFLCHLSNCQVPTRL